MKRSVIIFLALLCTAVANSMKGDKFILSSMLFVGNNNGFLVPASLFDNSDGIIISVDQRACCFVVETDSTATKYIEVGFQNWNIDNVIKIPTLIARYPDLLDFTNIPSPKKFVESPLGSVARDGKFDVTGNMDKSSYVSSYLVPAPKSEHSTVRFKVRESGAYWVCVDPPDDSGWPKFKVTVERLQFEYPVSIYEILLSLSIVALLYRLFKQKEDRRNSEYCTVVSKYVLFYIIIPNVVVNMLYFARYKMSEEGIVRELLILTVIIVKLITVMVKDCLTLLFCMGFGVVYSHQQTKWHREPQCSRGEWPRSSVVYICL
ncbi:hypothetical protein PSN45_000336 [Yamadazyma tenuis]|uniref:uncharacterized protein n=1 Tax=Candida tenuis TaxID=2315449 RepID=UPI00279EC48B|nr:hypothetical protein PSN45_000336 [Yamadazyma tenuis]